MAQGKHLKKTDQSYRFRRAAVAAVTAGLLLTPNVAFASGTIGDSAFEDGTASHDEAQTWVWDGAGNMTLNNYNGGGIYSEGSLTLELNGTNKITSTDGSSGVTANGNLTIQDANKDGGSLDVNITGDYNSDGIGAYNNNYDENGNQVTKNVTATIDGATVNVNVTNTSTGQDGDSAAYGIYSKNDVNIKNGANVTVNAAANDYAYGIAATHVAVTDSTVTANASTTSTQYAGGGYGIYAYDDTYAYGGTRKNPSASIALTNSTIRAKGPTAAIYAVNDGDGMLETPGTITINNSYIVTPGGARIQDVRIASEGYNDQYRDYGQVIGMGTEAITSWDQLEKDAVKDVVILPGVEAPKAVAAISAVSGNIPQTSDVTLPITGTFAASIMALLAGLGLSRRKQAKRFAE